MAYLPIHTRVNFLRQERTVHRSRKTDKNEERSENEDKTQEIHNNISYHQETSRIR